jgi:hypothetical protein
MYWRQKAAMICDTQNHLNTLTNQISSFLAGVQLKSPAVIEQSSTQGRGAACILIADYVLQADADQAWSSVKAAQTNAWIITPSFATYAAMNDDGTVNTLIERITW